MMDAVIDEIDGRMIRIGDHWLADFASCNYLGFDLDREIIDAIPAYLDAWGTHPSWSRLLGSPVLYEEIEERLTSLLGAEDTLVLPTITHIHMSVIPLLAASGTIFLDARAHKTIYDGCQVARARGAAVKRFRFEDPDHLDELLRAERDRTRLVCMDGVNSMTGNAPDIRAFAAVAREHGALLYVDDAHGFGVIGERGPDESCVYGSRGNSVVRHCDESYDHIVLVGGFSKAYSSLLAFIACPTDVKDLLKVAAPPYLYSGPSPVASLATVLAGFDVNETRGDELRRVAVPSAPSACWTAWPACASTRPTARASRSSRSRCATTTASAPSGRCSSTAASTRRWPPTRSSPRTRSGSASSSPRPTPTRRSTCSSRPSRSWPTAASSSPPAAPDRLARGGGLAMRGVLALRRLALWQIYLGAGALLTALYVWVPPFAASGPVFNLLGLSPVVAIVVGVRRYKPASRGPWIWFAVGMLLFWLGDLYTYSYPRLFGADVPFPSLGDGAYVAVYPALMAGLLMLIRRRNPESDRAGVIDSLIMTLGLALLSWVALIAPYLHDETMTLTGKLVSVAYPLGDILLLAAAIRLAVDTGKRLPAFYLLASAIVALLVTDFAYGVVTLHGAYHGQVVLDIGWISFYLLWGAAALHPSMRELEQPAPDRVPRLTPLRLTLLTVASLIAPVVEATQELRRGNLDLLVIIAASVVLFGLVVLRMAGLVRQQERSVARERTLSAAGASLVAATGRAEIYRAALKAVRGLFDDGAAARLCLVEDGKLTVVAAEGALEPAAGRG